MVQCRGLGDAVISTSLINSIHESWPGVQIDVWASPMLKPVFDMHPHVNKCLLQPFPLIGRHRGTWFSLMDMVGVLRGIRSEHYDLCLNTVGDVRENILTRLAGAKATLSVVWDEHHPFRQLIRPGLSRLIRQNVEIPMESVNIYGVLEQIAASLGCKHMAAAGFEGAKSGSEPKGEYAGGMRIVIHPLAGHPSREWPIDKWNELVAELVAGGHRVVIVGDPSKRRELKEKFATWRLEPRVSIVTDNVSGFLDVLRQAEAFIGLDSFGAHAAYSVGLPVVMINGSNDPRVWAPPGAEVVGDGGGCKNYPCYNRPKCVSTDAEYACVQSVETLEVMSALRNLTRARGAARVESFVCNPGNRRAR